MTADNDKYFPPNFATRQREEVDKLNALVDTVAATLASAAPKDSPAFTTLVDVPKHATAGGPAYAEGRVYYDTTLHKLRVGGAAAYETVTSV